VQLVVSDTGPINYLVLIGHIEVLPLLFHKIIMPLAVRDELMDPNAPSAVREWIISPPAWLEMRELPAHSFDDDSLAGLGKGEREAITLAATLHADLLLMDDRAGVKAALRKGFDTTGTIGILNLAAKRGLLDLRDAFARLRRTSFRYPEDLIQNLLSQHKSK